MNEPVELSLEQQFQLRSFSAEVSKMKQWNWILFTIQCRLINWGKYYARSRDFAVFSAAEWSFSSF